MPIPSKDSLVTEMERRLCGDGTFDECRALFRFEKGGVLQTLLHELKYRGKTGVGVWLGALIGEARLRGIGERKGILLPVPLHAVRRRERGYNQSELLCRGIVAVSGGRVEPSILRRCRNTPSQTSLGIAERAENVSGAFSLTRRGRGLLPGAEVYLVDDVITTGATLRASGALLRQAGAARVTACGVAVAAFGP